MTFAKFFLQLFVTVSICVGISIALCFGFEVFEPYFLFSLSTIFIHVMFGVATYLWSVNAAKSDNPNRFTQMSMMIMTGKLLLFPAMALVYILGYEPTTKWFVIPFFIIYAIFTVFEVMFMSALGNPKRNDA